MDAAQWQLVDLRQALWGNGMPSAVGNQPASACQVVWPFVEPQQAVAPLVKAALTTSDLERLTGRKEPTVIT